MLAVRVLSIAAALVYLALPGHPFALLPGLPLGPLGVALALTVAGWWLALPGTPPRPRLILAALVGLGLAKVASGVLAPPYGLLADYRVDAGARPERSTDWRGGQATRVDSRLTFAGDEWPVHFFNDVRRFNSFAASDSRRDLLPFSARWTGQVWADQPGRYAFLLESNGPASLGVAGQRASIERQGRVRSASVELDLPAGLHPIEATYQRPDEAMPWLSVAMGRDGRQPTPLQHSVLVQPHGSIETVRRDGLLGPMAVGIDMAFLLLLVLAMGSHAVAAVCAAKLSNGSVASPRLGRGERVGLAAYVVGASALALAAHLHLYGRAIILSGGNDWLAYEGFARDVLLDGPLLAEGRVLGQGQAFYYQPLYIYWLALVHSLLGEGLFGPLLANGLLGILAGVLVYALGRELFGRLAAACALVVFELCRVTFFAPTAGLLLSENLLIPLVPLVLLLLVRALETAGWRWLAAAGVVLGMAGLTRTTPLALLPPAVLLLALPFRRSLPWPGVVARLLVLTVACALTVGVATARNYVVSGRSVMITSSAGANLWEAHRPTSRVDLSRVDRDPLYQALGLDRQTREVVEFVRQDPVGYAATLLPMFLYAVGVVGAIANTWEVHPGLLGMSMAYALTTLMVRRARSWPTLFVQAFVLSHLTVMTVFFSHQYGFRLILPMYVGMAPIVGLGSAVVLKRLADVLGPAVGRLTGRATRHRPAGRLLPRPTGLLGVVGIGAVLVGSGAQLDAARRESFYGLNGDAALAARHAARSDLIRVADATYFAGDDSRSSSIAYLRGLAYPSMRWFDGARGMVFPPRGQQALYVLPDRAGADVARRCLGVNQSESLAASPGAPALIAVAEQDTGACGESRQMIGAPFEGAARLVGLDAPASIEPGQPLEVVLRWEALARPRERARPFARLVDSKGRRWGGGETNAYPSASWRPGEVALGVVRFDVDPTLPPGEYGLEVGVASGNGTARLAERGPWGRQGAPDARGGTVRLVSRSSPLSPDQLPLATVRDERLDGVRLLGATLDRETPTPGERIRLSLFWQNAAARLDDREVSVVLRDGPTVLREWRGVPVDGTYPMSRWKPSEIVRDTWDLIVPAGLASGSVELAVGLAAPSRTPERYVGLSKLALQSADRQMSEPAIRTHQEARFGDLARLVGFELKNRRVRPGENAELSLVWQALGESRENYSVALYLLDGERVIAQAEQEPAGGRRPTAGWTVGEYVEDTHRLRVPRDVERGRLRLAVGLVGEDGRPLLAEGDLERVVLQVEIVTE